MLQLTDDYKIGIAEIDEEHAYLVKLLNDSLEEAKAEKTDLQRIARVLTDRLKDYAAVHFAHEEAYMQKINDPELPHQKKEHEAFLEKVNGFIADGILGHAGLEEILQFMVRWIFSHILSSDMLIGKMKASEKKDPFAFTAEYETGIDLIDNEHKKLFEIIRRANDLIHTDLLHDKYDEIMAILDELKDYTAKHFHDEEDYMTEIGYPRLNAQKTAHAAFIDKLVDISLSDLDTIDENQQQYLTELVNYLLDWLCNHILKVDKLIAEWQKEQ